LDGSKSRTGGCKNQAARKTNTLSDRESGNGKGVSSFQSDIKISRTATLVLLWLTRLMSLVFNCV
jgi:hypothetical protein